MTQDGSRAFGPEQLQIVADGDLVGRDESPLSGRLGEQPVGSKDAPVPRAAPTEQPHHGPSE